MKLNDYQMITLLHLREPVYIIDEETFIEFIKIIRKLHFVDFENEYGEMVTFSVKKDLKFVFADISHSYTKGDTFSIQRGYVK